MLSFSLLFPYQVRQAIAHRGRFSLGGSEREARIGLASKTAVHTGGRWTDCLYIQPHTSPMPWLKGYGALLRITTTNVVSATNTSSAPRWEQNLHRLARNPSQLTPMLVGAHSLINRHDIGARLATHYCLRAYGIQAGWQGTPKQLAGGKGRRGRHLSGPSRVSAGM
ncbi:hypothetical protein BT67DRAFT_43700 [Trichocladium antarcticum]|uniref:Uncharacterized protein n=1 Tax=Trichocladium antarcticum TaxID=1450529 RepID=A0AAN6UJ96_9PEZI|nr:hypothetical protein BT67DRAFT_43700 [Trichocladium antarcticum]